MTRVTTTDCRSFDGVTVGLIDSIITAARVLKHRHPLVADSVTEALEDLRSDPDVLALMQLPPVKNPQYPIYHAHTKIPGQVIQYDEKVFIWHTIQDERTGRDPEMRVASSLKKAWAHLASHLRIKGVI